MIAATTKQLASAAPDDGNATRKSGDDTLVDPSSWLVTTVSKYHADGNEDGIVRIILDSSDITCFGLGKTNAGEDTNTGGMKELTAAEKEMRSRMKEYFIQKLEEKMKKI